MKVLEKNQIKVIETEKLLKEIIKSPSEFLQDEDLIKALKSQSAISKYENLDRNIVSCSLNTLKSLSEALLSRGFSSLDSLRVNAKTAIEESQFAQSNSKAKKNTAIALKRKVSELESQLDIAQRSNFLLTVIISELRSKLKQVAEHEGTIQERQELYSYHNKKIEAELEHTLNGKL